MPRRWLAPLVAGLLLCGCGDDGGGLATGAVAGYVFIGAEGLVLRARDEPATGEAPASGAQVVCGGRLGIADAAGAYRITGIFAGIQRLTATWPGALAVSTNVQVVAGQTTLVGAGGGGSADRRWLVLVYLAGDGAGEATAVDVVNALEQAPAGDAVQIVAQLDRADGFDSSSGDWTGVRRFVIEPDSDTSLMTSAQLAADGGEATDLGELDSALPATLRAFVTEALAAWPAPNVLLAVHGTGGGWRPGTPASRAVAADQQAGTRLTATQLAGALSGAGDLDLLLLDGELLQQLEVLYELRDATDVVVGPVDRVPGGGLPYRQLLEDLRGQPERTPSQQARALVETLVAAAGGSSSAAYSAVRTSGLGALATAVDRYAERLIVLEATRHDEIAAARLASQAYGAGEARFEGYRDLRDLVDGVANALDDNALSLAAGDVRSELNDAILEEGHTGGPLADANGLGIYFPGREDWSVGVGGEAATEEAYRALELAGDTSWDELIDDFARSEPRPRAAGSLAVE